MLDEREDYIPPVGFATEPTEERRRWIGRAVLVIFVALLSWMFIFRVCNPQNTPGPSGPHSTEETLPAPL